MEHICGKQERIEEAEAYFVQLLSPNGIDEDEGENPVVALDRFCRALEQTGSRTFFEKHGLHVHFDNLDSLFHLMDADRDGRACLGGFVCGLYRLRGGAEALGMQIESRETHRKEEQPQSIVFELHDLVP